MAAAHVADPPALYACLRHWHEPLRQLGSLKRYIEEHPPGRLTDPRILWIDCSLKQSKHPISTHCMEGIALLTLLARVDSSAWRCVLKEIWATDSYLGERAHTLIDSELTTLTSGRCAETYAMGVAINISEHDQPRLTTSQCISFDTISEEMKTALSLMNINLSPGDASVHIPVDFFLDEREGFNQTLEAIADLKAEQLEHKTSTIMFDIASINDYEAFPDVTALELLLKIRSLGVRIEDMSAPSETCTSIDVASRVTRALRSLLLESPEESLGMRCCGVEMINVSDTMSVELVEAVLSAVECSPVVRSVDIHVEVDRHAPHVRDAVSRETMWRIVARTLFSGRAQHQVKSLSLSMPEFPTRHLQAIRDELRKDNNRQFRDSDEQSYRLATFVTSSRFHLQRIKKGGDDQATEEDVVFETSEPLELRATRPLFTHQSRGWWGVMLPGRGEAWVEDVDVVSVRDKRQHCPVTESTFENITIAHFSDISKQNVGALLQIIGRRVKKLEVSDHCGDEMMDQWVSLVLCACPTIEDFEIGFVPLGSLEMFVQRAQTDGVRLRRLSIRHSVYHPRELLSFLEALSDSNHPLTIHLQDLTLPLRTGTLDVYDEYEVEDEYGDDDEDPEDVLQPVFQMLQKNRVLRKVVLIFNLHGDQSQELKQEIKEVFEDAVQEAWIPTGPLDMDSKVALLSVFHGEHAVRPDGMDSNIMAIIFEFAAPSVRRDLQLEISTTDSV